MADKRVAGTTRSSPSRSSRGDEATGTTTDDLFNFIQEEYAPEPKEFPGTGKKTAGVITGAASAATSITGAIFGGVAAHFRASMFEEMGLAERERREFNSTLLNMQADDIMSAQEEQAADYMLAVGKLTGKQRAGFASQGVRVNSSVAKRVEAETRGTSRQTLARLMNKARLEASGIRTQASFQRLAGRGIQGEAEGRASATRAGAAVKGFSATVTGAYEALDTAGLLDKKATDINAHRNKTP